jgi:hypothetical protein
MLLEGTPHNVRLQVVPAEAWRHLPPGHFTGMPLQLPCKVPSGIGTCAADALADKARHVKLTSVLPLVKTVRSE